MILLHRIGPRINSNFNTIEEILASEGPLSFDGVYRDILPYVGTLAERDVTLFVIGKYVGKDNSFDTGQPPGQFLDWETILDVLHLNSNWKIGYHSWSHRDLTTLSEEELIEEIIPVGPPNPKSFAYPGGAVNPLVERIVREFGYEDAYSVTQGNGTQFQKLRRYLNW